MVVFERVSSENRPFIPLFSCLFLLCQFLCLFFIFSLLFIWDPIHSLSHFKPLFPGSHHFFSLFALSSTSLAFCILTLITYTSFLFTFPQQPLTPLPPLPSHVQYLINIPPFHHPSFPLFIHLEQLSPLPRTPLSTTSTIHNGHGQENRHVYGIACPFPCPGYRFQG